MANKKRLLITFMMLVITFLAITPIAFASDPVTANIQNSQTKIFAFFKGIVWYIYGVIMIILFLVKQAAHGQGNESGEQKAKMGLWGATILTVGIYWGQDIWNTIRGWF